MKKVLLVLVCVGVLLAQKVAPPSFNLQYFDNSGAPLSGGQLVTCGAGTTCANPPGGDAATTYQTPAGTSNANPIILNSAGRANMYLTPGVSYKFALYTAGNVLIGTWDNQLASSLAGTATTMANLVYAGPSSGSAAVPTFRALAAADIPTLALTLAGSQFANQGTTVTLLHGNGAGNPAWGAVVGADFGTGIAARSGLGRNAATTGAPSFGTTEDRLAYQVAEIPSSVFVMTDFTTASSTALQLITGLTWTVPANTALNIPFTCHLTYSQATAAAAVAFGIQDATVSPSNIGAQATIQTNTTVFASGALVALQSTTATAIVSATPSATGTNYTAQITGFIEAPSNASSTAINVMVSTATSGDAVTVYEGSFCHVN
jgi:hypothetical protein